MGHFSIRCSFLCGGQCSFVYSVCQFGSLPSKSGRGSKLSVKDWRTKISALWAMKSLLQLLNSDILAKRQPRTTCKQAGLAVFQQNFIYTTRQQAGFRPGAVVCRPLLYSEESAQNQQICKQQLLLCRDSFPLGLLSCYWDSEHWGLVSQWYCIQEG